MKKAFSETLWFFLGLGLLALSCNRTIDPGKIITNKDIVRFLIRTTPELFSNSILDTTTFAIAGTGISFSRDYSIKTIDTFIVLNDSDTILVGGGIRVEPKFPIEAGAEIIDSLIGNLQVTKNDTTRSKRFSLPVFKFGYFQKLGSDDRLNRGWVLWRGGQTFIGNPGFLDSLRLKVLRTGRDTLLQRKSRSADPETDPQLVNVRNPLTLKPGDSVEVQAWGPDTSDFVFCHISDLSSIRRIQLVVDSTGVFFGKFTLSSEAGLHFHFRRLVIDAFSGLTFNPQFNTFRNEAWGIIYQIVP